MSNPRLVKLNEMLEKQPADSFLLYALGMEYMGLNENQKAETFFRQVLEVEEHNVAAKYQLAKLIYHAHPKDAILLLESGMREARLKSDMKTAGEFRSLLDQILFDQED